VLLGVNCGKKGPPLPPLVKLPVPAADLTAERHGDTVDVQFSVPVVNTDGTRPANVERVDVFAVTAPPTVTDDQLWKQGTRVGSVRVKAPRNPDQTIDPDEPFDEMEAPEGPGLDQGAAARVSERLTAQARRPVDLKKDATLARQRPPPPDDTPRPLLGPPPFDMARTYAIVGISTRGRRGPFSKRVTVPILDPPATLASPGVDYDEEAITITWIPLAPSGSAPDVLPSTPMGAAQPTVAYNVYDVSGGTPPITSRLTKTPVAEPRYVDTRIAWGERRCYTVRAVLTVGPSSLEGDEAEPRCVTPVDRFPPAAPKGLNAVPSEGAISLIWEPNAESDLRGYIVLRTVAPGDTLQPITPAPISQTTFRDVVEAGVRYVYAVRAVDAAGNLSAPSERIEETAR
jgi:hypothetical protein